MADLEKVASDLNSASQSLQELREKYNGALDLLDNKNTEITGALYSAKSDALQEIQTISDTATSQISQLKDTSLNLVNEAKNTATSEISSKKEETLGEFSQATSEFNSTKEEALSQIEQAKTEQGEKITALEQAKTEQESSITELKESVSTQGQKITEIEENNTTQGEKITALEQAKESITADINKKAKLLTENLTWEIGSGGDYETLFQALDALHQYYVNDKKVTFKFKNDLSGNFVISNFYAPFLSFDFNNFKLNGTFSLNNSVIGEISKMNLNITDGSTNSLYINSSNILNFLNGINISGGNYSLRLINSNIIISSGDIIINPNQIGIFMSNNSSVVCSSSNVTQNSGTTCINCVISSKFITSGALNGSIKTSNISKNTLSTDFSYVSFN
ncbi:coiled-coil domain-containing protein [Campylobacter jejuni]|uniref:coiled-coil domain-containing protein n=1 Tax=Campylobacter jejuni TaxID=197 RepID=UPI0018742C82|nr:hypothetical protein [Campylobacter jejuni]